MYVSGNLPTDSSVDGKDTESKRKKTKKKTIVGREKGVTVVFEHSNTVFSFSKR